MSPPVKQQKDGCTWCAFQPGMCRPINVHVTRHALATTIMTRDPRDMEVASAALAHRGSTSVNRVYDRSGAETADTLWMAELRDRKRQRNPG